MKKRYWLLVLVVVYLILRYSQLNSLYQIPLITPEQFLASQPYIQINGLIIIQPSSTLLVFLLGGIGIWVGYKFWRTKEVAISRYWWAIAMWLWGLSAISAGLSYQSFGYMFKAYHQLYVLYTSWPEIIYALMMMACIGAMSIAVAYTSTTGNLRKYIIYGTCLLGVSYLILLIVGVILPSAFLLSFTVLVLFLLPCFLVYFIADIRYYLKHHTKLHYVQLWCWVLLGLLMVGYYTYSLMGYTQLLWSYGWWFSDNDVLHILLILWMGYINVYLLPLVNDCEVA
jgi:hypothetical protein